MAGLIHRERGAFGNEDWRDDDLPPEPDDGKPIFTRTEHETLLRAAVERAVAEERARWQNEVIQAREARDRSDAEVERLTRLRESSA